MYIIIIIKSNVLPTALNAAKIKNVLHFQRNKRQLTISITVTGSGFTLTVVPKFAIDGAQDPLLPTKIIRDGKMAQQPRQGVTGARTCAKRLL